MTTFRVFGLVLAMLLVPFAALANTCTTSTVTGTYVVTFSGIDNQGFVRADVSVLTVTAANSSGIGSFSGTDFISPRGVPPTSRAVAGTYQIFSNCWVTLTDGTINYTGYVSDNGEFVQFSTAFDAASQLSGVARRAH